MQNTPGEVEGMLPDEFGWHLWSEKEKLEFRAYLYSFLDKEWNPDNYHLTFTDILTGETHTLSDNRDNSREREFLLEFLEMMYHEHHDKGARAARNARIRRQREEAIQLEEDRRRLADEQQQNDLDRKAFERQQMRPRLVDKYLKENGIKGRTDIEHYLMQPLIDKGKHEYEQFTRTEHYGILLVTATLEDGTEAQLVFLGEAGAGDFASGLTWKLFAVVPEGADFDWDSFVNSFRHKFGFHEWWVREQMDARIESAFKMCLSFTEIVGGSALAATSGTVEVGTGFLATPVAVPAWAAGLALAGHGIDGTATHYHNMMNPGCTWETVTSQLAREAFGGDEFLASTAEFAVFGSLDVAAGARATTLKRGSATNGIRQSQAGTRGSGPELFWHGSEDAVQAARKDGLFSHGTGSGSKFWATTRSDRSLLTDILIGGNRNVESLIPFRTSTKGGFTSVYKLTAEEAAKFSRAWGFQYSWNPYQWYKGGIGQYYYHPGTVSWGQRGIEISRAGGITVIVVGGTWGGTEVIDSWSEK